MRNLQIRVVLLFQYICHCYVSNKRNLSLFLTSSNNRINKAQLKTNELISLPI